MSVPKNYYDTLKKDGYVRVRIDDIEHDLSEESFTRLKEHYQKYI